MSALVPVPEGPWTAPRCARGHVARPGEPCPHCDPALDVRALLEHPATAGAAKGRVLARLTAGTATQNAAALDDLVAALQRELVRTQRGRT